MLRAYGPNATEASSKRKGQRIPDDATWIDLEEPTHEEEKLVEQCIGLNVPTREDMVEIEPSSRLYEHNGALYMTVSVLCGVEDGDPSSDPIGFVLTDNRLVTVRYVTPKPVRAFEEHARREPGACPAMLRPCWCGCSTRSSTGSPTSWRMSSSETRDESPRHIFQARPTSGAFRPTRLTALADPNRPNPDPAGQGPLYGGQHRAGC